MANQHGGSAPSVGSTLDFEKERPVTEPNPDPFFAVEAENEDEPIDMAIPTVDIVAQRVK